MHSNPHLVDNESYVRFEDVSSLKTVSAVRSTQNTDSFYHCPRCDKLISARRTFKSHFKRCLIKHGNPDDLKWYDHISLQPTRKGGPKDQKRNDIFRDSVEACSGVTIPSKLPPGQSIVKFVSTSKRGSFLCAIRGGGPLSVSYRLKSHFVTRAKKNGNPTRDNWYDRLDPKHTETIVVGRPDAIANVPLTM